MYFNSAASHVLVPCGQVFPYALLMQFFSAITGSASQLTLQHLLIQITIQKCNRILGVIRTQKSCLSSQVSV